MKLGYLRPYTPTCDACAAHLTSTADGCSLFEACSANQDNVTAQEEEVQQGACQTLLGNNTAKSPYILEGCVTSTGTNDRGEECVPLFSRSCNVSNGPHEDRYRQNGAVTGEEWNIWGGWKRKNTVNNANEYDLHNAGTEGEDTWRVKIGGDLEGLTEPNGLKKAYNIEVNARSTASGNIDQDIKTTSEKFLYRWTNFQGTYLVCYGCNFIALFWPFLFLFLQPQPAKHPPLHKFQINFQIAMIPLSLTLKMGPLGLTKIQNCMYQEEGKVSISMSSIPALVKEKRSLPVVLGMILLKATIVKFEAPRWVVLEQEPPSV